MALIMTVWPSGSSPKADDLREIALCLSSLPRFSCKLSQVHTYVDYRLGGGIKKLGSKMPFTDLLQTAPDVLQEHDVPEKFYWSEDTYRVTAVTLNTAALEQRAKAVQQLRQLNADALLQNTLSAQEFFEATQRQQRLQQLQQ